MNEIYQQKMERYSEEYVFENCEREGEVFLVKDAYQKSWHDALENQWISVDEALPEEDMPNCFVAYKTFDMVFYSTGSYEKDNDEWYVDGAGFNVKVTHYMPIPSLEGGKE